MYGSENLVGKGRRIRAGQKAQAYPGVGASRRSTARFLGIPSSFLAGRNDHNRAGETTRARTRSGRKSSLRSRARKLALWSSRLGAFESLEQRILLSAVAWTGAGDGKSWNDAQNWSTRTIPGASDDVTIDLTNSQTIIYSSASGNTTIGSLNGSDPFSITGGSLTVTANSTLTGTFSMMGGAFEASGSGVTVSVNGSTTLSGANLYAENGASLTLSGVTSYANPNSFDTTTFEATGTGSTLSLPNLTGLGDGQQQFQVEAFQGGQTLLPALAQITTSSPLCRSKPREPAARST
jgi:hypothetical protein